MNLQSQLILKPVLIALLMFVVPSLAQISREDASINELYNTLLQQEYVEPVVFPNHQVERKAQRSPSLRLRFGRSDPEMESETPAIVKRWFDEVKQKPIRSPSLRLRFGRRSDPSMPVHGPMEEYENQVQHNLYDNDESEAILQNNEEDLYDRLMHSEKIRNLLLFLYKYGNRNNEELAVRPALTQPMEGYVEEYERAIRKPGGPLRLRWGRSTGGVSSVADLAVKEKNKVTEICNEVDKSPNCPNKD